MKTILLITIPILFFSRTYGQNNCSNPVQVSVCPQATFYNQTNAGMGDDGTGSCNIPGEDLVFEVQVPPSTMTLFVSVRNATGPMQFYVMSGSCNASSCMPGSMLSGSFNGSFNVSGSSIYYFHVDAASTVTFDISFGVDTASAVNYYPGNQGNWTVDASGCASPVFKSSVPFYQISYNGTFQTDPMTLAPLNQPGNLCIKVFLQNQTGLEGARQFQFLFGPHYNSISTNAVSGFYQSGTWTPSLLGNAVTFNFINTSQPGRGDGDMAGCLEYEFCFTLTPLSNDPATTTIDVSILGDAWGGEIYSYEHYGCCPSFYPQCLPAPLTWGNHNYNSISFTATDPGILPVELLNFEAMIRGDKVVLNWITASEINNDFFTVERSVNGVEWIAIIQADGAGNSTETNYYTEIDRLPLEGISYYRLKQTDFDGTSSYSNIVAVNFGRRKISIYPNPGSDFITVLGIDQTEKIILTDRLGAQLSVPFEYKNSGMVMNCTYLQEGLYFLLTERDGSVVEKERILIIK